MYVSLSLSLYIYIYIMFNIAPLFGAPEVLHYTSLVIDTNSNIIIRRGAIFITI